MTLCECGCGQEVNPGRRFIHGHNNCKTPWTPLPEPQLCECGCGQLTNPGMRYIDGHYRRWSPIPIDATCIVCGDRLTDDNWSINSKNHRMYKCNVCIVDESAEWRKDHLAQARKQSEYYRRISGQLPMAESPNCPLYLGVHVAENILKHVFKDVEQMPHGNPGYDFICNRGKKIDVKSSCMHHAKRGTGSFSFCINKNQIADHFLCIAFDNRTELNPLHLWMFPSCVVKHQTSIGISESTIDKWDEYRLDINKVVTCCDIMRGK